MGARVAATQVLRWTLRNATSTTCAPLQLGRRPPPRPLCSRCRLFCSSSCPPLSPQRGQEAAPLCGKPDAELSLRSLVEMGFTDTQAEQIYDFVSKGRRGGGAEQALQMLTALFVLGLNPSNVLKLLEKCPELYAIKESQLQQRIGKLRKLGLIEGSVQRVVAHYPHILTVPLKKINGLVAFLKEKCLFTTQQVTNILRQSPAIVEEDLDVLEYKFQYVYFRMGIKQAEMVKSRLFRVTLDEVRYRHSFLERRGFYQTPDKKGQTSIVNPKLDSILQSNQEAFLTKVAMASAEEYDVFQRLVARELKEEEHHYGKIKADTDNEEEWKEEEDDDDEEEDDDDEEMEEEEEAAGKSSYRQRRKK